MSETIIFRQRKSLVQSPINRISLIVMMVGLALSFQFPTLHSATAQTKDFHFDVVIYGGTSSGIAAAVQAKRMGKSVIVVAPDQHLGGLTAGGLGWTDSGNKNAIGGISREFYQRIWKHYQQPRAWKQQAQIEFGNRSQGKPGKDGDGATMWVFEPHVAESLFEDFVKEYAIPVHRDQWLDREHGVKIEDHRIRQIIMLSGNTYHGKMFIDATYEGDLLAAANVSYHVGREANSVYNEKWNGIQLGTFHHQHWFATKVDPYKVPGDPTSGLLPNISSEPPGVKGAADKRLQAYCFRMCMTDADDNRLPFEKPDNYDPWNYEVLRRLYETGWRWKETFGKFDPIPNRKTDTNNLGPFSTDYIGKNYDYPEGTYEQRKSIIAQHRDYQLGLMYYLTHDPGVPVDVRNEMSRWGLSKNEFTDNGGWPHQIYVREARRMIGQYVMTEHDCLDTVVTPDSIGMGAYTLDSHNCQRYVTEEGFVQNEGDIGVPAPRPYEIAYGAIVPKKDQCQNLLVPVCVSSSHIAFGSIRMEPVFMILGQSAATAACMSIDQKVSVQDLPYGDLQKQLIKDQQVLTLDDPAMILGIKLQGIVLDDQNAEFSGNWVGSTSTRPFVENGYHHDANAAKGMSNATFSTNVKAGDYEIRLSYSPHENRASNVPVSIDTGSKTTLATVNQRQTPKIDALFHSLGTFQLNGPVTIVISNKETDGYVIVDAVQLILSK